ENADLRKQVEDYMEERTRNLAKEILSGAKIENGVKVCRLSGPALPDMVKNIAFSIRKDSPEHTVFIGATIAAEKPLLTLMITDDLVKEGLNASQIVREAAKLIKGGGGGQPFFAQAGGKDADGLSAAADKIISLLKI
ncbi:MAG: alanine--tRNA ligase, partial [Muribaculaceae bacterium]|nr:alanine--tRNA ligase [Muribaculaceae bacterium]